GPRAGAAERRDPKHEPLRRFRPSVPGDRASTGTRTGDRSGADRGCARADGYRGRSTDRYGGVRLRRPGQCGGCPRRRASLPPPAGPPASSLPAAAVNPVEIDIQLEAIKRIASETAGDDRKLSVEP